MSDLRVLLTRIEQGDPTAAEELLPLVYEELRKLAAVRMANEAAGHTLQPTALVHEAWLRLAGNDAQVQFANRAHFFAAAAEAMRRILIERARRKSAEERGGEPAQCPRRSRRLFSTFESTRIRAGTRFQFTAVD